MPVNEAGTRIEPPPSVPRCSTPAPVAAATAAPPLRAARRQRVVPGIAGDPGQRRIRHRLPTEFRRRRQADQHGARLPEPGDGRGILARSDRRARDAAVGNRLGPNPDDVLDGRRRAVDRRGRRAGPPAPLGRLGRSERFGVPDLDEGVEAGVDRRGAAERGLSDLDRRERAARVGGGQFRDRQATNLRRVLDRIAARLASSIRVLRLAISRLFPTREARRRVGSDL